MKQSLIILLTSIASLLGSNSFAQTFWFDQSECLGTVTPVYTYSNYPIGSHGHGYDVYRNGQLLFSNGNSMGGYWCDGLRFANDSTGFLIENGLYGIVIRWTQDYGANWVVIGSSPPNGLGFYIVSEHTGYLFSDYQGIWVTRCSDPLARTNPVLTISSPTRDSTVIDTIAGWPLCAGQTHITGSILNSQDTLNFTVVFQISPVGIQTISKAPGGIKVFPNPASASVNLESGVPLGKITVRNLVGETVYETQAGSYDATIGLNELAPGIYIVEVLGGHYRVVKE